MKAIQSIRKVTNGVYLPTLRKRMDKKDVVVAVVVDAVLAVEVVEVVEAAEVAAVKMDAEAVVAA